MKNDTSKVIDLDSMLSSEEKPVVVENTQPEPISVDWDSILAEWSYRCPKGYPTVVDGVFTEYEEVKILNEILEEKFGDGIPLPEAKISATTFQKPDSKNTDYKEGMVVYFLGLDDKDFNVYNDYLTNPKPTTLPKYRTPEHPEYFKSDDLKLVENGIGYLVANQSTLKASDLKPYIEPFSTAKAIRKLFGKQNADRGSTYKKLRDDAATVASNYIKKEKVESDKWCPADMFIYAGSPSSLNFKNKSLNLGRNSVNGTFVIKKQSLKGDKVVGISLKESEARAGKAKSFQDVLTRKSNYQEAPELDSNLKAHISVLYHIEEVLKKPEENKVYYLSEAARRLSKIQNPTPEATTLYNTLLPIVKKSFGGVLGKNVAKKAQGVKPLTSKQLKAITTALQGYKQSIQKKAKAVYNTHRKEFYTEVTRLKYKTDSGKSNQESSDPHTLLKKAGCYKIATWFVTGLDKGGLTIPAEFKALSKERGAFVALTAYAVGMAGISPNFLKAKGGKTVDGGEVEPFYGNGFLDAVDSKMTVRDTKDYKGFQVDVITAAYESNEKGAKPQIFYKTILDFRYSGDALFIEVGRLTPTGEK